MADSNNKPLLVIDPPPAELEAEGESVNQVLADQARGRAVSELWTTAVGGGVNALLLWTLFPPLHWLAGGFAAVGAYGLWGLLDRKASILQLQNTEPTGSRVFVELLRNMTGLAGWVAALYAVISFLHGALGTFGFPGG